jgi:hypothetical protein
MAQSPGCLLPIGEEPSGHASSPCPGLDMHPLGLDDPIVEPTERTASGRIAFEKGDEEDAGGRDDFGRFEGVAVLLLGMAAIQFLDQSAARWAAT